MSVTGDLFTAAHDDRQPIVDGMVLLHGFIDSEALMPLVESVTARAPMRHLETPGGGRMSVAMTNCGQVGWVSDRRGYRYSPVDPMTGEAWPGMPPRLHALAVEAAARAGFPGLDPDVCLINRYTPGTRLGAHQDRDEGNPDHPIVSMSMGLPANFLLYGTRRGGRARRIRLVDGDVLVFGGPARMVYHGVGVLADGVHPVTGAARINLTFRRAR